jgi:hypothetical protein
MQEAIVMDHKAYPCLKTPVMICDLIMIEQRNLEMKYLQINDENIPRLNGTEHSI